SSSFVGTGFYSHLQLDNGGSWDVTTNGYTTSGSVYSDGSVWGEVNNDIGIYLSIQGYRVPDDALFQSAEGYYTGTWSSSGVSGRSQAILSAEGQIYFAALDSNNQAFEAGSAFLDRSGHFHQDLPDGTTVDGTLA